MVSLTTPEWFCDSLPHKEALHHVEDMAWTERTCTLYLVHEGRIWLMQFFSAQRNSTNYLTICHSISTSVLYLYTICNTHQISGATMKHNISDTHTMNPLSAKKSQLFSGNKEITNVRTDTWTVPWPNRACLKRWVYKNGYHLHCLTQKFHVSDETIFAGLKTLVKSIKV